MSTLKRWTGSVWEYVGGSSYDSGTWISYNPATNGANFTLGSGSLTGSYKQDSAGMVDFWIIFTLGAGSAIGAAAVAFGIPISMHASHVEGSVSAVFNDNGTGVRSAGCKLTANSVQLIHSTGWVSTTSPFTWVSGDQIFIEGRYRGV